MFRSFGRIFGFSAVVLTGAIFVPWSLSMEYYKTCATFVFFVIWFFIKALCGNDAADKYSDAVNKTEKEK